MARGLPPFVKSTLDSYTVYLLMDQFQLKNTVVYV